MESNGKFVAKNRQRVNYQSGVSILASTLTNSDSSSSSLPPRYGISIFRVIVLNPVSSRLCGASGSSFHHPAAIPEVQACWRGCSQLGSQRGGLLQARQLGLPRKGKRKTKELKVQPQVYSATDSPPTNSTLRTPPPPSLMLSTAPLSPSATWAGAPPLKHFPL